MTVRVATYAATRPVAYLLERGVLQTISCPIRHGATGSLVDPDSGTITIMRPDGTTLVSGAVVTVSSSTATYDLTPSVSETLGEGWTVIWTLTFDGQAYPAYRYEAYLCEYIPPCSISAVDLYTYEPELRHRVPQSQGERGDNVGWQPQIDSAYYTLLQYLIDSGTRVWLIRGMTGAREWLRTLALSRSCRTLGTTEDSVWMTKAADYMQEHRLAQATLKLQDETMDPGVRSGMSPIIRLAPMNRPLF